MMWQDSWGAGSWLVMSLGMLIFWTLVVVGIVWAVRSSRRPPADSDTGISAQILDARFARSEIPEDEYRRRRDLLAAP